MAGHGPQWFQMKKGENKRELTGREHVRIEENIVVIFYTLLLLLLSLTGVRLP